MISRRGLVAGALILVVAAMPALLAGTRYANYVEHLIASAMLLGLYAMAWDFLNGYVGILYLIVIVVSLYGPWSR